MRVFCVEGAGMRGKQGLRLPLVLAFAAVSLASVAARATRPEACFALDPALPIVGSSCSYGPATVNGGIDGIGSWIVTIQRPYVVIVRIHGVLRRRTRIKTIVIRSDDLPSGCVRVGPRSICPIGTIHPGDHVTAQATAPVSFVGVGNPCPVPNPGAPPPIAGGRC